MVLFIAIMRILEFVVGDFNSFWIRGIRLIRSRLPRSVCLRACTFHSLSVVPETRLFPGEDIRFLLHLGLSNTPYLAYYTTARLLLLN
jgi:hypothetical protein